MGDQMRFFSIIFPLFSSKFCFLKSFLCWFTLQYDDAVKKTNYLTYLSDGLPLKTRFKPRWDLFVWSLHFSHRCVGFSVFLLKSKNMLDWLLYPKCQGGIAWQTTPCLCPTVVKRGSGDPVTLKRWICKTKVIYIF